MAKRMVKKEMMVWILGTISLAMYGIQYLFFGRFEEIILNFLSNFAFLPIYVLFVTLMIERVLKEHEREAMRQKLNMVIGAFFSEVGRRLLRDGLGFVEGTEALSEHLKITYKWRRADFRQAEKYLQASDIRIDSRRGDLNALREFLLEKRGFMLRLMENPNLLEHENFTDLLWAVFHLIEELEARKSLDALPESDLDHLSGDLKRAYLQVVQQWLSYIQHLQHDYPYLFSLAVRTNPFNPEIGVEVV